MRRLDRYFTPDEQTILLFLAGTLLLGLALRVILPGVPVILPEPEEPKPVDIRTAGVEELTGLPGIGPRIAERIVQYRADNGFGSVADLLRVPGIGDRLYEELKPMLVEFGSPGERSLLDLNRASAEELETLPGLGSDLVRRILLARHAGVVFHRPQDLLKIPGFGAKTIEKVTPYIEWENHHGQP